MRARLHIIREGPLMAPMRVWPSSMRCRVAASPPCQLVAPMDGTSVPGSPAGSITTNGMERLVSSACPDASSPESTRITPCGRRAATWSAQVRPGVSRPALSDSTTLSPAFLATFSTPRMTSIAQALSSSWKTRSISGDRVASARRRR